MKQRLILITTPADAPALRTALAAAFGRGWDTDDVLTPYPPDPTPATTATPTAYILDAPFDEQQAAVLAEIAAGSPDRTLRRAKLLGVENRPGVTVEGERLTLAQVIDAHAAKEEIKAEKAEEVAWIR